MSTVELDKDDPYIPIRFSRNYMEKPVEVKPYWIHEIHVTNFLGFGDIDMDVLGKPPASKVYASGAVFELSHRYRDHFLKALRAEDTGKLSELFRATYALFMDQPETVGLSAAMFNRKSEDTDPKKWEVSCASLPDGSRPVRDAALTARLAGIVFSDAGDRYYSCMLNRDRNKPSEVVRNMGKIPHEKAGVIRGNETEPLKAFLECIREDRA